MKIHLLGFVALTMVSAFARPDDAQQVAGAEAAALKWLAPH